MTENIVRKFIGFSKAGLLLASLAFSVFSASAQSLPTKDDIAAERILGNKGAPLEIIEYASLTCPHCADFYNGPLEILKKEFIDTGKAKLIYRDFPTDQLALAASMIARCAAKERYFGIIKLMYKTQADWRSAKTPIDALSSIGRLAGMSKATIEACIKSQDAYDIVMKLRNEGSKKFEIDSTPTLIVNGKKLKSGLSVDEYRNEFNAALKNKK